MSDQLLDGRRFRSEVYYSGPAVASVVENIANLPRHSFKKAFVAAPVEGSLPHGIEVLDRTIPQAAGNQSTR